MKTRIPLLAAALLAALSYTPAADADGCADRFDRDYVCRLQVHVSRDGWNWRDVSGRQPTIELQRGGSIQVQVTGLDQDGDEFPDERMWVGVDTDRDFDRRFEIERGDDGRFSISSRDDSRRAEGRLRFWLPGNLNLDHAVTVRTRSDRRDRDADDEEDEDDEGDRRRRASQLSPGQERFLCASFYQAILGRDADPAGLEGAARKLREDGVDALIDSMFSSQEFQRGKRRLDPDALLADYYRGLFGREVDDSARRGFGKEMRRGKHASVLKVLVRSEEYQDRLRAAR